MGEIVIRPTVMEGLFFVRSGRGFCRVRGSRLILYKPLLALAVCCSWTSPAFSQEGPPQAPDAVAPPTPSPPETVPDSGEAEATDQPTTDPTPADQEPAEGTDQPEGAEPTASPPEAPPPDSASTGTLPLVESEESNEANSAPGTSPPADPFSSETAPPEVPYFDEGPPTEEDDPRRVSITLSPIHLFMPILEATIELRAAPGLGLAGIVGLGSVAVEDEYGTKDRLSAFEAGAQIVWYPLDAFDSLQLGAELLYVHVSGDLEDVEGYGAGLAVGPFVGYKLLTDAGFTLFVQGGFQYMTLQAEARGSDGATSQDADSAIIPLLNFNLGWSF